MKDYKRFFYEGEIFIDHKGVEYKVVGLKIKNYRVMNIKTGKTKSIPLFMTINLEDFTLEELKPLFKKYDRTEKEFFSFISGQTVGMNDKKEIVYYGEDVGRFFEIMGVID